MNETPDLDRIRGAALDRVDRARRWFWGFFWMTAAIEGVLVVVVLLLADWSDPLHHLLLAIAGLIYLTLGSAILALGAYVAWSLQRILAAIER